MHARVQQWVGSLALGILSTTAEETGLHEDTDVQFTVRQRKLVVGWSARRYALADLLVGVTQNNLHAEAWNGTRNGTEVW